MKSIVSIVLAGLAIVGCIEPNQVIEPQQNTSLPPSAVFSIRVKPILDQNCGGSSCHGGGPRGFAGGLDLTSYQGMMRGSKYGPVVISGSSYMSHIIQTINQSDTTISPLSSVTMPASRDPILERDVRIIADWISAGARDDNGELPFPEPRPLGKVFFSSQYTDLVGVIDIQTGLVTRYVQVGHPLPLNQPPQSPHNVQVDDQGKYYYVTMITGNTLKKYDAVTNQLVGEVAVGLSPAHVVITQDGSKAYVTNFNDGVGQVFVIATATMTVQKIITHPLMRKTHGARLSHDGTYLYVGNNVGDLLSIIRTANDSVVANLHVATGLPSPGSFVYKPYQIAVRNDDQFIYVTCQGPIAPANTGMLSVFRRDGDTFSFVKLLPVGRNPLQCEVTRDMRFVYVCNQASGSVTVISADSNEVYTTIDSVGKQPHGIDITEDSRTVYVTCENIVGGDPPHHPISGSRDPGFVAIIDVNSNRVIRRIEVGGFAAGVSVSPGKGN
ncbi:MAG: YncE family protein [Bacteroidota bacterium]